MDVRKLENASVPTVEALAASMATTVAAARSGEGKVAMVAGSTGLVGRELVRALLLPSSAWELVYGVARRPPDDDDDDERYRFLACDLLDRGETVEKLSPLAEQVTHLFWVTWASQFPPDTQECCDQNRAMLSNALDALLPVPGPAIAHLALQTGTNHYVSIKHATAAAASCSHVYYEEESPRVGEEVHNFYYVLEDLVKERLGGGSGGRGGRRIASWSVHRPGLLLGSSRRSHFNMMGSLCVYASICRHLGLPFRFHGLRRCWEEPYMDASDARLVADQNLWWTSVVSASTSSSSSLLSAAADCQAFNAVNGTAFTWKEVWPALAAKFGLHADDGDDLVSEETSYGRLMEDKGTAWEEIVAKESLRPTRMDDLANWAFVDNVFHYPAKMLVSAGKARRLGFATTYTALESLLYWVDRMREERLIPSC